MVTEAGFGADLGAEKFIDIKCRKSGLRPSAVVIVVTVRAMKYHGGVDLANLTTEDTEALDRGLVNLERHVENITKAYNLPCVVSINKFTSDTDAEIALIEQSMKRLGVNIVLASHWSEGGKGAADLARLVVDLCESDRQQIQYVYEDQDTLWEKINKTAKKFYRAREVVADKKVQAQIEDLQRQGYDHYPVCVAKKQSSFSTDPKSRGAPDDHAISVREVRVAAGAEFVVMVCGDIMTIPSPPKNPSAGNIDYIDGRVVGLF